MASVIYGTENANAVFEPHSQVYYASHELRPNNTNLNLAWYRKKYMNRSFISFSFGGKWIEDFNLIAVSGDRLQKQLYGDFENITTNYDILDGQFYWGTHFNNNKIDFTLATDGMTQIQLEEFKTWFAPGKTRTLILAEHPNRAIEARLDSSPSMSVIPFEQHIELKIDGNSYPTSTTIYKGEISISFIMDEPYWYSISHILARKSGDTLEDTWIDANGQIVNIYSDKDALKIIAEDGVPARDMLNASILIGDDLFSKTDYTLVGEVNEGGHGEDGSGTNTTYAEINNENQVNNYGFIGPRIAEEASFVIAANSKSNYLYYPGTAPAPIKLAFTLSPVIDSNDYIKVPKNSFVYNSSEAYNVFYIEGTEIQEFRFTTPSIYTAYNQAIKIFKNMSSSDAWADISTIIKEKVLHYHARKWALMVVAEFQNAGLTTVDENSKNDAISFMKYFLQDKNGNMLPASFVFNSKTGSATGYITCRKVTNNIPSGSWADYGTEATLTENVGDMLRSSFIFLKERNLPNNSGQILAWTASNKTCTHRFYHNVENGLWDVGISYDYLYY